jgi:hypothetical protein
MEESLAMIDFARRGFPQLKILAWARNGDTNPSLQSLAALAYHRRICKYSCQ